MKIFKTLILVIATLSIFTVRSYGEDKVTGSASIGVYNRYIFRGYEIGSSAVVQPAVSISYKGFSATYWGNIDTEEKRTQSFVPDREGQKSFNEVDLILSYTYPLGKLSLTGGYIYYNTKYTSETEEFFISLAYDTILKPVLTIYRDINEYVGTYINLTLAHSIALSNKISLDLGASASYFAGEDDYWNTYESSTGAYTGEKYRAFHDGMVKAGLTIPVADSLTVQPVVQYFFPLSSKAKRIVDGNSYNPNGHLDETFVTGVNVTLSF
ncbi:MAG: hypothetical protein N2257_07450 [Thermodesulfovibrionales bacterium]|nr:hypothetical protein [Thermodesulfovibrionales bacterium]